MSDRRVPSLVLALALSACAGTANPNSFDAGGSRPDGSADAMDSASSNDGGGAEAGADASVADSVAADEGPSCAALGATCDATRAPCCPGLSCASGVAGFTCVERTDCSRGGQECALDAPDSGCCPGLVCMVRGGAGGTACADPMCRQSMQSCDGAHPCCPSSACAGPPGMQQCLPTP